MFAGPWAGQIFANPGAEVIKVEHKGVGAPFLADCNGRQTSEAAYFLSCNRGKKSVTIVIKKPAGQDLIKKLAAKSDFLLENYKVGGLAKYGFAYEDLRTLNPALIYCSITGFGQTGPYRDHAGYDFMIDGRSYEHHWTSRWSAWGWARQGGSRGYGFVHGNVCISCDACRARAPTMHW